MSSPQHIGIRACLGDWAAYNNDCEVGFVISHAGDIEEVGWRGTVKKIRDTVGDIPVHSMLTFHRGAALAATYARSASFL